eukprot:g2455.t1
MSEDSESNQEQQPIEKAKTSQYDYDNEITHEDWEMVSQKVAKIEQREISLMFVKFMETEIGKIMDKAVVLSVSEPSSQEVVDKYLSSLANKVQSVVSPVLEDIVRKSLQTAINTAVEDAVKRKHQEEVTFISCVANEFNLCLVF